MPSADHPAAPHAAVTFRDLVHPHEPEAFLARIWGQRHAHLPGPSERFASLFSWEELNRLLAMTRLWSERTMKVVLDGREVEPERWATWGGTRDGVAGWLPAREHLGELINRGATLVLDVVETLAPGPRAVAAALQSVTGGATVCNVYCSWQAHQGFPAHFDTTDVFALQIDGVKRWRLYEGRALHPVDQPGHDYSSLPPEHHQRAKGNVLESVEMTPGDLLYLPRGQYHEALASSEASLHLSFGVSFATGLDVVRILARSVAEDPLFRAALPHFDAREAVAAHVRRLGEQLARALADPDLCAQIIAWQRARALRDGYPWASLPERRTVRRWRVRELRPHLVVDVAGARLERSGATLPLGEPERALAQWALARDVFTETDVAAGVPRLDAPTRAEAIAALERAGVLERM